MIHSPDWCDSFVLACGESIGDLLPEECEGKLTVGVNDVEARTEARIDHLLVLECERRFKPARAATIRGSAAGLIWMHAPWPGMERTRELRCKSLHYHLCELDIDDESYIPAYCTTAFAAAILAYRLGGTRIGLVGVDLVGHPDLEKLAGKISAMFGELAFQLRTRGVSLRNMSSESLVVF